MDDIRQEPEEASTPFEQAFAETLERGEMKRMDPGKAALNRLIPPYVIRVKTENDPILEEIQQYRCMAEEVDDRYDAYVEAAKRSPGKENE